MWHSVKEDQVSRLKCLCLLSVSLTFSFSDNLCGLLFLILSLHQINNTIIIQSTIIVADRRKRERDGERGGIAEAAAEVAAEWQQCQCRHQRRTHVCQSHDWWTVGNSEETDCCLCHHLWPTYWDAQNTLSSAGSCRFIFFLSLLLFVIIMNYTRFSSNITKFSWYLVLTDNLFTFSLPFFSVCFLSESCFMGFQLSNTATVVFYC